MSSIQRAALAIYFVMLIICILLVVSSEYLGPTVRGALLPVATEGIKLVLAALIGAVSAILGAGNTSRR